MSATDTYLTVKGEAQAQFVEQRSRFISFIWHVTTADEVKQRIAALQKEYYDARHVCYAYMLGAERTDWRANDNGEPSDTLAALNWVHRALQRRTVWLLHR